MDNNLYFSLYMCVCFFQRKKPLWCEIKSGKYVCFIKTIGNVVIGNETSFIRYSFESNGLPDSLKFNTYISDQNTLRQNY